MVYLLLDGKKGFYRHNEKVGIRQTECFYKIAKGEFSLVKEFHCKSMEALVSHTSIVFTRYIALEWALRKENDPRTIGNLFYITLDEIRDKEFIKVFNIFLSCLESTLKRDKANAKLIITEALDTMMESTPDWFRKYITPICIERNERGVKDAPQMCQDGVPVCSKMFVSYLCH